MAHQRHVSNLLASSTLLHSGPPSPYTQSFTLAQASMYTSSRRGVLSRAVNSPFAGGLGGAGGGGGRQGGATGGTERETPTKKKKSRVQTLGVRDDDDVSSVGGERKRPPVKKRKPCVTLIWTRTRRCKKLMRWILGLFERCHLQIHLGRVLRSQGNPRNLRRLDNSPLL